MRPEQIGSVDADSQVSEGHMVLALNYWCMEAHKNLSCNLTGIGQIQLQC